jgi:hypothetical protein
MRKKKEQKGFVNIFQKNMEDLPDAIKEYTIEAQKVADESVGKVAKKKYLERMPTNLYNVALRKKLSAN